ncbi:hypothetical protein ACQEVI_06780 [Promicromonospora sp. CA-289599]|uniref:hypothetical protein n=1 Tax=Promicromonospora sp. CA-289599 TaxID=3240014 RepID=UPI003D93704B
MTTKTETRATGVEQRFPASSTEGNPTTVTRPIAVGYVSAVSDDAHRQQHQVLATHAASAGMSLAHVVEDPHDSVTLSELLEIADAYGAARMFLPEGAPMAARYRSLTDVLKRIDAVCAVVPAASPSTAEWLCA